ncbi:MAG TPA: hypothetical protein VGR82_17070, partial [Methylomirabilota bacterium]|nr:hypothetical protein [Methylomirabilota bacterium]
ASTMVLARLLIDQGELHSRHGRVMVGITLVEDLAVVVLTVLLPEFARSAPTGCSPSRPRLDARRSCWCRSDSWRPRWSRAS